MPIFSLLRLCVLGWLLCLAHAAVAQERNPGADSAKAQRRVALVIGNGAYRESPLRNPVNDARAMAIRLREQGFDVIAKENLGREQMEEAVREFGKRLDRAEVGLFYFAGHGMQIRGRNYLIPTDARIEQEDEVAYRSFDAGAVLDKMDSAKTPVNLVILDACRNNPFHRLFRAKRHGLAEMEAPSGTLIAFATAPGSVAMDGDGDNGVYTKHLLKQMGERGVQVEQLLKRVRVAVTQETKNQQVPWESSSLKEDFYFLPPANARPAPAEVSETVLELAFWDAVKSSASATDYAAYLEQYPKGRFAVLARARYQALRDQSAPPPRPTAPVSAPAPVAAAPAVPVASAMHPAPAASAPAGDLTAVGFSSDGRWLATAAGDGRLQIVGTANNFVLKRFTIGVKPAAVGFSPDGAWLAVGAVSGEVSLLDVAQARETRRQSGHDAPVVAVAFSPDNRYLLSAARNGDVLLRSVRNGETVNKFRFDGAPLQDMQYAPDGRYFAVVQGEGAARQVKVLDIGSGREMLSAAASTVSFSVNGGFVMLASRGKSALVEISSGRELKYFTTPPADILKGAYADSGDYITTFDSTGLGVLWRTGNGNKVAEIQAGARRPRSLAFSPDAKVLALIDNDGRLGIYRFREKTQ